MKITGELLKSERINKNLSVQDVAHALKLSPRIIQALENGQTEELPAKTFVRGFVKSYADYLKIDTEAVLKQFQEEMGSTLPVNKTVPIGTVEANSHSDTQSNKRPKVDFGGQAESISGKKYEGGLTKNHITTFAIVLSLIIAIVTVNKIISHYEKEVLPTAAKDKNEPQTTALAHDVIATSASAPVQAAVESVPTTSSTLTLAASSPTTSHETAESKLAAKEQDKQDSKKTEAVLVKLPVEKSKGTPVEMLLEARKDTTIEYAKGNTADFKKLILKANTYQILKSTSGLHIRAEDGSAVNITINGMNKGLLSPSNKPIEITY
ncbi:MAG: helix-turn-helix domain-containing protein [Pseudobdellovibrio sp.]